MKKCSFITIKLASIVVWLCIWQLAASYIDKELFLPQPSKVFDVLINNLLPSLAFWKSLLASIINIGQGFLIGAILGILFAILSSFSRIMKILFWFPIKVLKAVPVASFVILSLLWTDSEELSVVIPAMVVLPVMYINTLTGIDCTDAKLLEMADVFQVPVLKRIANIYVPNTIPHILSACSLAVGMAWKSGIAAEIIGLAKNSIGNELYKAKLYFMIPELFAWTIVIIVLSIIFESLIKFLIKR